MLTMLFDSINIYLRYYVIKNCCLRMSNLINNTYVGSYGQEYKYTLVIKNVFLRSGTCSEYQRILKYVHEYILNFELIYTYVHEHVLKINRKITYVLECVLKISQF